MNKLMRQFIRCVDCLTEAAGKLCAAGLFAIGFIVTFEVLMRYWFNAPTIWADEVSRILQLWVVFLASAGVLKQRQMITVTVLLRDPTSLRRRLAETLAIAVLAVFMGVVVYYGFQLWLKATLAGHTTDSYLAAPLLLTRAPVWLGGALLLLQGLVQLIRVWTEDLPADDTPGGMH